MLGYARQNAVAFLALFVALGGTGAYAANTIGSADVIDESLVSADVRDGSLAARDVTNNSLTNYDILNGTLIGADVLDNSLKGADIDETTLEGFGRRPLQFAQRISGWKSERVRLAAFGPFTLEATCDSNWLRIDLWHPPGTSGDVQWSGGYSQSDGPVTMQHGGADAGQYFTPLGARIGNPGTFSRFTRTAYLRSGSSLYLIDFNAYHDYRAATLGCMVYGHVTQLS